MGVFYAKIEGIWGVETRILCRGVFKIFGTWANKKRRENGRSGRNRYPDGGAKDGQQGNSRVGFDALGKEEEGNLGNIRNLD